LSTLPKPLRHIFHVVIFNISLIICVYRMTVEKVELMTKASY